MILTVRDMLPIPYSQALLELCRLVQKVMAWGGSAQVGIEGVRGTQRVGRCAM